MDKKSISNFILATFQICCTIPIVSNLILFGGIYIKLPFLIRIEWFFIILCGLLLYSYVKSLTSNKLKFNEFELFFFILHGILLLSMIPFYFQNDNTKIDYYDAIINGKIFTYDIIFAIYMNCLQWVGVIMIVLSIVNYNKKLKTGNSAMITATVNLKWMINLLSAFIICLLLTDTWIVLSFFKIKYVTIYRILPLITSILIFYLGYKGIINREIFSESYRFNNESGISNNDIAGESRPIGDIYLPYESDDLIILDGFEKNLFRNASKYYNMNLKGETVKKYYNELLVYMEKEKPFTDMELNLQNLSEELNISRNHLSFIINDCMNLNFYDFINHYRIEMTKILLLNTSNSIINIAYDSGFRSKSTFNKVFKKFTGLTPTEFIRENKPDMN